MQRNAGMHDNLREFTRDEIATALGVDAVILGRFEKEQTKS
ncbi:hypothetical protein [Pontibacter roseus]|nr:hypothetical protein [Pontibacter roseus]